MQDIKIQDPIPALRQTAVMGSAFSEVYNMDCIELMKHYPDNYFDLAVVDVPYGIGESSNDNKSRSKLGKSKDYGNKNWDDFAPNMEYFIELKRVSKERSENAVIPLMLCRRINTS